MEATIECTDSVKDRRENIFKPDIIDFIFARIYRHFINLLIIYLLIHYSLLLIT